MYMLQDVMKSAGAVDSLHKSDTVPRQHIRTFKQFQEGNLLHA
jgi:hypothetical protein